MLVFYTYLRNLGHLDKKDLKDQKMNLVKIVKKSMLHIRFSAQLLITKISTRNVIVKN